MAKTYTSLPTQAEWAKDMDTTGLLGRKKFPAFERVGDLLGVYHAADRRARALKHEILFQVYRHTGYILKYKDNESKLGTKLNQSRTETVEALRSHLHTAYNISDMDYAIELSRSVDPHGQDEDDRALTNDVLQYYTTKAARREFKLSFRAGLAQRWTFTDQGGKRSLDLYDTVQFNDQIENGMSLYVMDTDGRIYVSGREGEKSLKHSSFLGGAMALAAGTIRIENGRVVWITGKSGHYRPTVQQMLNVLERLRAYQVDLTKVTVYRENYTGPFANAKIRNMEAAAAAELLRLRSWPGSNCDKMRVG